MAGGLSSNNPSAPTRTTRVAEISNSSKPSAAVTQLVAKLEGSSPSGIGTTLPTKMDRPQVVPSEAPTTLIASIQQNRAQSKTKQHENKRSRPAIQPSAPTPASDPVMLALNTVVPTPTSRISNTNDVFDVTPVASPTPAIADTHVAEVTSEYTRYPDIGAVVAFADPEPVAPRKAKAAPKRPRAIPSPVVQAPEPLVQQASVQIAKPRRF